MVENICDLKLQRNWYMHEAKETSTSLSLSEVKNDLLPLKLVGSLSDQVAKLAKIATMKYKDFSVA